MTTHTTQHGDRYRIGTLFVAAEGGSLSMLVQTGYGKSKLVHLRTGNRWYEDEMNTTNAQVTVQEFRRVTNAHHDDWRPVEAMSELEMALWCAREAR